MVILTFLDPAHPKVRKAGPPDEVRELDRRVRPHMIMNGECYVCQVNGLGPETHHCRVCNRYVRGCACMPACVHAWFTATRVCQSGCQAGRVACCTPHVIHPWGYACPSDAGSVSRSRTFTQNKTQNTNTTLIITTTTTLADNSIISRATIRHPTRYNWQVC